jgi:cysteinyl-tRNA synthetase
MREKRNPTDFALWKFSPAETQRQMEWESPWGKGFPGWHIECSAMSVKYLGNFFDIHCGGEDHISVHHTNEIAQTQACHGTTQANFWLHGHFLQLDSERMSKSSGEFLRLQSLIDRGYDPIAYRLFCLSAHYRAKLNFNWEGLTAAQTSLQRLRNVFHDLPDGGLPIQSFVDDFSSHVYDDLNMPRALAVTWDAVKSNQDKQALRATLVEMDKILGLGLVDWQPEALTIPPDVAALAEQRTQARADKNWELADALRKQINAAGFEIKDTASGVNLSRIDSWSGGGQ